MEVNISRLATCFLLRKYIRVYFLSAQKEIGVQDELVASTIDLAFFFFT